MSPHLSASSASWPRDPVHEVDQAVVVDAAVLGEADFAGAAGGDAFAAVLYDVFEGTGRGR